MLHNINADRRQKLIDRLLSPYYNEVCTRANCEKRIPLAASLALNRTVVRAISIATLVIAAMFVGSILSLIVHAQNSLPERVGVLEAKQEISQSDFGRLSSAILLLQQSQAADRDRMAEQQSRISTMEGIGIGLGSIVMVLQVFAMMFTLRRGIPK